MKIKELNEKDEEYKEVLMHLRHFIENGGVQLTSPAYGGDNHLPDDKLFEPYMREINRIVTEITKKAMENLTQEELKINEKLNQTFDPTK